MRRYMLSLLMIFAAIVSCSKKDKRHEVPTATVVFNYQMVSEVPMTKAVDQGAVATWIDANLPSKVTLKLKNDAGETYTIQSGTASTIPVGEYTVTGTAKPTSTAAVVAADIFLSNTYPTIAVSGTVNVTYDRTEYTVPATYKAFGIAIDLEETASATFESSHGESGNIAFAQVGGAGLVFVNGTLSTHSIYVTLTPSLAGYQETTFTFSASGTDCVSPTWGNYYILHPGEITSIEGGTIGYTIGGFTAVDIP